MNGLLRGDMQARAEFYKTLDNTGAITSNQIRRLEDMNGYDGGDVYFRQLNQIDTTKLTILHMGDKKPSYNQRRETETLEELINGKEIY